MSDSYFTLYFVLCLSECILFSFCNINICNNIPKNIDSYFMSRLENILPRAALLCIFCSLQNYILTVFVRRHHLKKKKKNFSSMKLCDSRSNLATLESPTDGVTDQPVIIVTRDMTRETSARDAAHS